VLGDGDDAGRRFNQRVARDLPDANLVWLPEGEDARGIVQRDPAELGGLLAEADWYRCFFAGEIQATDLKAA
jgi:hypothetical protein